MGSALPALSDSRMGASRPWDRDWVVRCALAIANFSAATNSRQNLKNEKGRRGEAPQPTREAPIRLSLRAGSVLPGIELLRICLIPRLSSLSFYSGRAIFARSAICADPRCD